MNRLLLLLALVPAIAQTEITVTDASFQQPNAEALREAFRTINTNFTTLFTNSAELKLNRENDNATNITFFGDTVVTPTGALIERSLETRFGAEYDARDRTVSGDATDDTEALQDLLDDAGEHAVIQLGPGNYIITNSLKFYSGQKIRGVAGGPQFSNPTNAITRISVSGTGTHSVFEPNDRTTNTYNVEISNLHVSGGSATLIGIDFYRTSNSEISWVTVSGCDYGVIVDANIGDHGYFNRIVHNKIGYNRVANLMFRNGANDNHSQDNWLGGSPYSLMQTNTASANTTRNDHYQGVGGATPTTAHIWNESGVLTIDTPYIEVADFGITNSVNGRIELMQPRFGGLITHEVASETYYGVGLWTEPVPSVGSGFRGWLGTVRMTNDWSTAANNWIFSLNPRIRSDLAAATNANYLINYGSEVVSGSSTFSWYGNNSSGTLNTNRIAYVDLKDDGGFVIDNSNGAFQTDSVRFKRGEGDGEASLQANYGGSWAYGLRTSRTNTIVNNLVAYTNVTAGAGAFTNALTLGGTSVSVAGHTHADATLTSLNWSKLTSVPAGFADGTDDTGSGGFTETTIVTTASLSETTLHTDTAATGGTLYDVSIVMYNATDNVTIAHRNVVAVHYEGSGTAAVMVGGANEADTATSGSNIAFTATASGSTISFKVTPPYPASTKWRFTFFKTSAQ